MQLWFHCDTTPLVSDLETANLTASHIQI